jgi:hypothetical protein
MDMLVVYKLIGSAVVIAFMVGVAALLGFRDRTRLDETEARRRIAELEPGAHIAELAVGEEGRAAIARLEDGRFIALRAMAGDVTARAFSAGRFTWRNGKLIAEFGDFGFPALHLSLKSRPDWLDIKEPAGATRAS